MYLLLVVYKFGKPRNNTFVELISGKTNCLHCSFANLLPLDKMCSWRVVSTNVKYAFLFVLYQVSLLNPFCHSVYNKLKGIKFLLSLWWSKCVTSFHTKKAFIWWEDSSFIYKIASYLFILDTFPFCLCHNFHSFSSANKIKYIDRIRSIIPKLSLAWTNWLTPGVPFIFLFKLWNYITDSQKHNSIFVKKLSGRSMKTLRNMKETPGSFLRLAKSSSCIFPKKLSSFKYELCCLL